MENMVTILLAVILAVREYQNWRDRRDLLDRIMCTDYREFKRGQGARPGPQGPTRMSDEEMAEAEKKLRG